MVWLIILEILGVTHQDPEICLFLVFAKSFELVPLLCLVVSLFRVFLSLVEMLAFLHQVLS